MKFSLDSVLSRRMPRLSTESERHCGTVKLKGVEGNEGQFLSCSDKHRFYLFTI